VRRKVGRRVKRRIEKSGDILLARDQHSPGG